MRHVFISPLNTESEAGKSVGKDEKIVYTTRFGAIPESQLARRNAEYDAEQKRRREEAAERLRNKPAPKLCPLAALNDFETKCREARCALFEDGACVFTRIKHGDTGNTTGKRCPLSGRSCTKDCIMNADGGCIIAAIGKE